jgi:hypothetical protein
MGLQLMAHGPYYGEFSFSKDAGFSGSADGYARGGKVKPFWDKPAPAGEPKHLSKKQKSSAKARAAAAGRPYPNLVDNAAASRRKEK